MKVLKKNFWGIIWSSIALFSLTALAAGEVYWEPYKFKGTEYFRYKIIEVKNGKKQIGKYVIKLEKISGSKVKIHIKGKLGVNEGSFSTVVENSSQVPGAIMAQAFFNPWIGPLAATILGAPMAAFFSAFTLGSWEVGSGWTRTEKGKKVSVKIEGNCSYAGKKGRKLVHRENGKEKMVLCVAKGVALPLYMKSVKTDSNYYETTLIEYREK